MQKKGAKKTSRKSCAVRSLSVMLARLHVPRQITAASSNTACLIGLVVFVRPPLTLVARRVLECTLARLLFFDQGYFRIKKRREDWLDLVQSDSV